MELMKSIAFNRIYTFPETSVYTSHDSHLSPSLCISTANWNK